MSGRSDQTVDMLQRWYAGDKEALDRLLAENLEWMRRYLRRTAPPEVRARFESIQGLSAHADADELLRWLGSAAKPPGRIFVTHGEPEASHALAGRIEDELPAPCLVPRLHDDFDLDSL